jgi:hypothetical protein
LQLGLVFRAHCWHARVFFLPYRVFIIYSHVMILITYHSCFCDIFLDVNFKVFIAMCKLQSLFTWQYFNFQHKCKFFMQISMNLEACCFNKYRSKLLNCTHIYANSAHWLGEITALEIDIYVRRSRDYCCLFYFKRDNIMGLSSRSLSVG